MRQRWITPSCKHLAKHDIGSKPHSGNKIQYIQCGSEKIVRTFEYKHCGLPRCESILPDNFTDRECEAYVWLSRNVIPLYGIYLRMTKMTSKGVYEKTGHAECRGVTYDSLIDMAKHYGWEG